ncbi:coiled-coil domain-containing protein [Hyphomonas pacifica]|uniref:hypothetical protein n=1 Tax=Hyphomonas pacifica TaxID=1280941 RepID=UPI000DBF9DE3|nr:hypothetical protein [Hyphomonas pacifica]RAN34188.1 hypothetical protein HY11_15410 [Hyphomonas pacifica]
MFETRLTESHETTPMLRGRERRSDGASRPEKAARQQAEAAARGSFRERLEARKATRPQSTLAIDSGIRYPALKEGRVTRAPRAVSPVQPPCAVQTERAPLKMTFALPRVPDMVLKRTPLSSISAGALPLAAKGKAGLSGGGHDDDEAGVRTRLGDVSQIAFAGLAVLGLAGLSVMAADSALHEDDPSDAGSGEAGGSDIKLAQTGSALGGQADARPGAGQTSALALAAASEPVGAESQPWFDYKRLAVEIASRQEEAEAARARAEAKAAEEAERRAAAAIADAEAARLAEEQQLAQSARETRLAEEAAEKKRLAELEAHRVAEAEALRQAELEARRVAEAEAEARRLEELEARRLAEAEAETRRLAELDARRAAEVDAMRRADIAAKQAIQEEMRRQAGLAAQTQPTAPEIIQVSAAPEEDARLVSAVGITDLPQPASLKPASIQVMAPAAMPEASRRAAINFVTYTGAVPKPASMKPAKPLQLAAATPTERSAPKILTATTAGVRAFDRLGGMAAPVEQTSQKVEDFIVRRVQVASDVTFTEEALDPLRADFLELVNGAQDGSRSILVTPDGRQVEIFMEQTLIRDVNRPVIRTVSYSVSHSDAMQRSVETAAERVPVTCRDIAYAIPGAERGRFAACESGKGDWLISRATDRPGSDV